MANVAKVILIGNLTRDPQLTHTPNTNTAVCDFGMAINHRRPAGADGQARDEVCFIEIRAFGRQAETLNQYMKKGRPLYVEGRLAFEQWTGQDGQKKSRHRVIVNEFQFLGDRRDDEGGGGAPAGGGGYQNRQGGGQGGGFQGRQGGGYQGRPANAPAQSPRNNAPPPPDEHSGYGGPDAPPDGPPSDAQVGEGPDEGKIPF